MSIPKRLTRKLIVESKKIFFNVKNRVDMQSGNIYSCSKNFRSVERVKYLNFVKIVALKMKMIKLLKFR